MDNRLAVSYRMVLLSQGVRGLLALIVFITSSGLANALCLQDPDASVSNAKAAYQHAQTAVVNATSRLDAARTTGLTGNDARKSAEAETARREMNGEQERLRARRQQLTVEEQDSRAEKEIGKLESASLDLKASKNKLREECTKALEELRQGLFCSECMLSKTELEASGKQSFSDHLRSVSGTPVPATPDQIEKRQKQCDRKQEAVDDKVKALDGQAGTLRQQEIKRRASLRQLRESTEVQAIEKLKDLNQDIDNAFAQPGSSDPQLESLQSDLSLALQRLELARMTYEVAAKRQGIVLALPHSGAPAVESAREAEQRKWEEKLSEDLKNARGLPRDYGARPPMDEFQARQERLDEARRRRQADSWEHLGNTKEPQLGRADEDRANAPNKSHMTSEEPKYQMPEGVSVRAWSVLTQRISQLSTPESFAKVASGLPEIASLAATRMFDSLEQLGRDHLRDYNNTPGSATLFRTPFSIASEVGTQWQSYVEQKFEALIARQLSKYRFPTVHSATPEAQHAEREFYDSLSSPSLSTPSYSAVYSSRSQVIDSFFNFWDAALPWLKADFVDGYITTYGAK